jgi:hypothetical protein
MDFNEKHLNTIDNLLKFLPRCRPPEDSTLEESFVFAQSFYFLFDLKKAMIEDINRKKQQAAALQSMAQATQTIKKPKEKKDSSTQG